MRTRALAAAVAAGALALGVLVAVLGLHDSPGPSTTQVLGEHLTRPVTGLSVDLHADRTTVRTGQPVHFATEWSDDDGQRLGWSTLTGDEGAAKYVKPACRDTGRHPDGGRLESVGSYARPGTYTAYVEITTGGCGAATEMRRATVVITVTDR